MQRKPKISVCCITYNQESYINDALKGFLDQKGDFDLEVLIGDDNSDDDTYKICQQYYEKYPNIFRIIKNSKNLGGLLNLKNVIQQSRGEYIALCEGDDYWIDPDKLNKQLGALGKTDIQISFHASKILYADSGIMNIKSHHGFDVKTFTVNDLIGKGAGFIPTASIFARSEVLKKMFSNYADRHLISDYFMQIYASYPNGALYLPDVMSVRRKNSIGSHSVKRRTDNNYQEYFTKRHIGSIKVLNEITDYKFNNIFEKEIQNHLSKIYINKFSNQDILKQFGYKPTFKDYVLRCIKGLSK